MYRFSDYEESLILYWMTLVEGLYYLCGENKGADQLRGYPEADLRLCIRICKKPVYTRRGSYALLFMILKMYKLPSCES